MLQEAEAPKSGQTALIALGANTGPHGSAPEQLAQTLRAAIKSLADAFGPITLSDLYATPCFPAGAGPDFVNAACACQTEMPPEDILAQLHIIEAAFGRERTVRWGQRTLDLDLIGLGGLVLPDPATFRHWRDLPLEAQAAQAPDRLILPHPRVQDRAFVLVPLADVAADWVHPVSGQTVAQMRDALGLADRAQVVPL